MVYYFLSYADDVVGSIYIREVLLLSNKLHFSKQMFLSLYCTQRFKTSQEFQFEVTLLPEKLIKIHKDAGQVPEKKEIMISRQTYSL